MRNAEDVETLLAVCAQLDRGVDQRVEIRRAKDNGTGLAFLGLQRRRHSPAQRRLDLHLDLRVEIALHAEEDAGADEERVRLVHVARTHRELSLA